VAIGNHLSIGSRCTARQSGRGIPAGIIGMPCGIDWPAIRGGTLSAFPTPATETEHGLSM